MNTRTVVTDFPDYISRIVESFKVLSDVFQTEHKMQNDTPSLFTSICYLIVFFLVLYKLVSSTRVLLKWKNNMAHLANQKASLHCKSVNYNVDHSAYGSAKHHTFPPS